MVERETSPFAFLPRLGIGTTVPPTKGCLFVHSYVLAQIWAIGRNKTMSRAVSSDAVHFQAPIVISRDHHDVSGTDSPFRETSNIADGSAFTAGERWMKFLAEQQPTDGLLRRYV